MPEPLSIAAACATIATSLLRCIDTLVTIHAHITTSSHALHILQTELQSLQKQVLAVQSSPLSSPRPAAWSSPTTGCNSIMRCTNVSA